MYCESKPKMIGLLYIEKSVYDLNPPYQRQSGLWSKEKSQLFIDSIFNQLDVPKIYMHDLRNEKQRIHYAVIDGKQRLSAIWDFIEDKYPLSEDFQLKENTTGQEPPKNGKKFSQLPEFWRSWFNNRPLDIVLLENANDDDVEDLFSRLNNGEPLNAAEKRNAMGGDMCALIKKVAEHKFFVKNVKFGNDRYQHYEVAAKSLLIEKSEADTHDAFCDLKKKFLDKMVKDNQELTSAYRKGLYDKVDDNLKILSQIFKSKDPLLAKQAYPPLYYLFVKQMYREYAHAHFHTKMSNFLEWFNTKRIKNLQDDEDKRDYTLVNYDRLMQQGTNDLNSLRERVSILRKHFLQQNPDVRVKDRNRAFTSEERYAIWITGGRACSECKRVLELEDMEADHAIQWAHGGETLLKNAKPLCGPCNSKKCDKVS